MECLDVVGERLFDFGYLVEDVPVDFLKFTGLRHGAAEEFVREHEGAVHEVAEHGHQLVVVACLEVGPCEVVVLGFGSVRREHVAQHVLLAREVAEVFVQPHGPVARGADFVALEVQELVGGHVVGQLESVAVGHEHGREYDAVEDDVVLAYEVDDARLGVLPPLFPRVGQQFLGVGDVAYGRVEPYVEHLAVGALCGYGNAPVEVTGDGTRLEAEVEPRLALAVDVGLPFLVAVENPVPQTLLPAVEGQIPVVGLAQHGRVAGLGAARVDKLGGAERRAALLALVAVGARSVAYGALADDVAVGDEAAGSLVVELHRGLLYESALRVYAREEFRGGGGMCGRGGAGIDVERDA